MARHQFPLNLSDDMIFLLSTGRNKPALPPLWTLDPLRHPPASCGVEARTGTPVFDPSVGQKERYIEVTC